LSYLFFCLFGSTDWASASSWCSERKEFHQPQSAHYYALLLQRAPLLSCTATLRKSSCTCYYYCAVPAGCVFSIAIICCPRGHCSLAQRPRPSSCCRPARVATGTGVHRVAQKWSRYYLQLPPSGSVPHSFHYFESTSFEDRAQLN